MRNGPLSVLYEIEHKRAALAYAQVQNVPASDLKQYRSATDQLPAMILANGLLQTLAFYKAKTYLVPVYEALEAWFRELYEVNRGESWDLIEHLLERSRADYRADTYEALAFATWLKRFAVARSKEVKRQEDAAKAAEEAASGRGEASLAEVQPEMSHETEESHE